MNAFVDGKEAEDLHAYTSFLYLSQSTGLLLLAYDKHKPNKGSLRASYSRLRSIFLQVK